MSKSINVSYEQYVLEENTTEYSSPQKTGLLTLVLFVLSGCPNTFNIQDLLWLELPWFEESQPEGDTLPSIFVLAHGIASILILGLLCIETYVPFPKLGILYCSSFVTLLTCIALIFGWSFSFGGISMFLFLGAFAAAMVGWVQYIFVIPWIADNYNPRIISLVIAGDELMIASLIILQIIQEPGGSQNFSPTIIFLIAANFYAITCGVCVFTFQSGIGRLVPDPADSIQALEPWRNCLWTQTFPSMFWDTKLVTFGRIWVQWWSFTVHPMALPYASENATGSDADDGVNFLQWAMSIGLFMGLAGALGSYIPTEKYWIREGIALNTISNGVVLIAAANIGEWSSWLMNVVLMTSVAVVKFSCWWVLVLCMRELASRFPDYKELLVRSNSLWTLYGMIILRCILWMIGSGVHYW